MPIRGKSATAKDPDSALKSKRKTPTKTPAEPKTPKSSASKKPTLPTGVGVFTPPQIQFPRFGPLTATPTSPTTTPSAPATRGHRQPNGSAIVTHRRDLTNVDHGLELPTFEPNQWTAKDLFTNSSPLPETSQADADAAVLSIARKRQTLRIVRENIGLNRDVVGAATEYQQLVGDVINYSTELVNNQTRFTKYLDAGVKQQIAGVKLAQSQEQWTQETIALKGMQQMTSLVQEEWDERLNLRRAKINGLREQTLNANARLAGKRQALEAMFNVEFATV